MKKILLLLLVTCYSFAQTGTTTAGQFKMTIPVAGANQDSVVVWNGTDKKLKFIGRSTFGSGGTTPTLQQVTDVGATTTNSITLDVGAVVKFIQDGEFLGSIGFGGTDLVFGGGDAPFDKIGVISTENLTTTKALKLPNVGGFDIPDRKTLVASLNNVFADNNGNVENIIVVNSNATAVNSIFYTVIANATFTDPTPAEGKGYTVFVRNGTATIGGVGYTSGSLVYRFYHSGAWGSTLINSGGSAITPDYMILRSDYTLTDTPGLQKIFNVGTSGNGSFNSGTNKTYCFRMCADFTTLSAISKTVSFGFLGTATITSVNYKSLATLGTLTTPQTSQLTAGSITTAQTITSASASTEAKIILEGIITVTTAGTIIPAIGFSSAQAGMLSKAGNTFEITEIGNNTFTATTNMD